MLENFLFSANAVVPIFFLVVFGYFLKEKKYIDANTIKNMDTIVFKFALPAMLFLNISSIDFSKTFDFWFLVWVVVITISTFIFSWIFAEIFIEDNATIGSFVQGSFRGNYTILGLVVISNILGPNDTGKSLLVTTFVVPLYNILSVLVLTFRNGKSSDTAQLKSAVLNIVKNPLIIGIALGMPFSLLSIDLPIMVKSSLGYLANLTMPLALIAIGGNIDFSTSFKDVKWAVVGTFFKTILYPIVAIFISASIFSMRGENLVIIFVMTSTPTAVSSYIMAKNMGADENVASNLILFTTLVSLFTFTLGIYILKTLNLI